MCQVRVKWRQVLGVVGEKLHTSSASLTHPLGRAGRAVGQRLHALLHFCRTAMPSLPATLAPRAPLLAGVLWGLEQADQALYKDNEPASTAQDLPASLLHSGLYALQSHAEVRPPPQEQQRPVDGSRGIPALHLSISIQSLLLQASSAHASPWPVHTPNKSVLC